MRRMIQGAVLATLIAGPAAAFEPGSTECIAPANPGGGWDFTCRQVGRLLSDLSLVPSPMQIVNMPGGQGAVAYANVASKRSDDANLVVATSIVGVTGVAQGRFPGDVDTMRWLATLGSDVAVVMVAKDSPYNSLTDLLNAFKDDPKVVATAGSSYIGGWDHLRLLMLAQESGVTAEQLREMTWVEFDGGSDAVTQLMGGHVGAVVTDLGEIGGFIKSGDVKALAVMSEERVPAFPELATAREQGIDVVGYNWRGFYMGGDVDDEAYDAWVDIMHKLYDSPEWKQVAEQSGLIPLWKGGDEFETFVRSESDRIYELSKAIGVVQ
ncbi:Bug family tripartite tricarboxylate transporter substrate binding protein [Marinivivus vitaminiproducens]|uniref:Bug family tripartite tricarboxylate transporter substrate binding protein n=1 Tax=Marinivivus vitaminiproducens TaxID=3035935 RepID=UPI0027A78FC8|nr:tripartite tricarboxylate transporter substrate-binding protein [Geminicoccaceae bacterium SCSIO 64248]